MRISRNKVNAAEVTKRSSITAAAMTWGTPKASGIAKFDTRMTCEYKNVKYVVYFTSDFDNQISTANVYALHPYDEAEYTTAFLENNRVVVGTSGKPPVKQYRVSFDYTDENTYVEQFDDALESMVQQVAELDTNVKPRIIHDSTDISRSREITASTDEISDEVKDIAEEIREQCVSKLIEIMQTPEFGFSRTEAQKYSAVDAYFEESNGEYWVVIEARAEVSYDALMDIATELDLIVEAYDNDAYFDAVEPGIIAAWINASTLEEIESCSSVPVTGGYFDPPEYDEPEIEEEEDTFTVDLTGVMLHIDDDGNYTINENDLAFIDECKDDSIFEAVWDGEYDSDDIYEKICECIADVISEPGVYVLQGNADFQYKISQKVFHKYSADPDGGVMPSDEPVYADLKVDYSSGSCELHGFGYTEVRV